MRQIVFGFILFIAIHFSCESKFPPLIVETSQRQIPILINKAANEVLKITVIKTDSLPVNMKKINIVTIGTENLDDIQSISIFYSGANKNFSKQNLFSAPKNPAENLWFEGNQLLGNDTSYFWVSYQLKSTANLLNSLDASLLAVVTNFGKTVVNPDSASDEIVLKTGIALRQHWDDSVHTYRIPGLTTTNKGTLLGIYDVRRESGRDLQGHIDIGLSRSEDGGQSWDPMIIVLDMKNYGGLPEKFNGVSDACILVDRMTNTIYIAGLWMHGVISPNGDWIVNLKESDWNHQWRNKGSQPGLGKKQTSQFLLTKSTDDGKTWSEAINITNMCKDQKWWLWAPAPGHGITLKDGTLVFPTQGRDENGLPFSNITYSKDRGETWNTSNPAYSNTTESMAVELANNGIMLNMRDNRNRIEKDNKNGRAVSVSFDLGETWEEHSSSHSLLIEPVCMASIHKHSYVDELGEQKSILLFSNPNSKYQRIKQTIKVSFDEGKTWPDKYWIELDQGRGAGYSCLTSVDENTIGILYEGSQAHMTFQKINLSSLIENKD